jgi:FkbM family methyltransferase
VKLSLRGLNYQLHRVLSKSRTCARLSARLRNQANCVVAYHLGESYDSGSNGEYRLLDLVARHCNTFVDVGANVGHWTEYFSSRNSSAKGILFEPSAHCAGLLREKFQGKSITVREAAVGDRIGSISFVEEGEFGESSSIAETYIPSERPGDAVVRQIPIVTLDEELKAAGINIDFLKIDAEGYDLKVLKGAELFLSEGRVRFVQFEYNSNWLGTGSSLREAKSFLERLGFELFLIRSTGLHPIDYSLWGDYFRYSNFLACRAEDKKVIASLLGPSL